MLSIQQLAEIASRHLTVIADAMIAACVAVAIETGEPLDIPERHATPTHWPCRPEQDVDDVDWQRMVEGNADTRWCHV